MTIQNERQRERRANVYQGLVTMLFGVLVLIVAAVRDDDHSWQGYLIAGAGLSVGGFFLIRGLRR